MIGSYVKPYIASYDGEQLTFVSKNDQGDISFSSLCEQPEKLHRTWLAIPGEYFIRRFHIKPFEGKRTLRKILPNSLENMLFKSQQSLGFEHTLSTSSTTEHKFTSYSIEKNMLKNITQQTASKISSLTGAVPLPFGLAYFATEGEPCVILTQSDAQKITAVMVDAEGQVADYRMLEKADFEEQAQMMLQSWCNFYKELKIYTTPKFKKPKYVSEDIQSRWMTIPNFPQGIKEENLALYGLMEMSETHWNHNAFIAVKDPSLTARLKSMSRQFIYVWGLFFVATVLGTAYYVYNMQQYNMEKSQIEENILATFNEAMPNTPLVDAPLQMTRRVNELALLAGNGLVHISPLDGQLVHLQNELSSADIAVILDELSMTRSHLQIKGQLASLSQVDKLQTVVKQTFPSYEVSLKSAQIRDDSKVDFYVEAVKK